MQAPETRYARSKDGNVAYQIVGDGPRDLVFVSSWVRCACAIRDAVRVHGLEIRAGLHTGEVELAGETVRGIAVHIGARVAGEAGAGEVLVSSTSGCADRRAIEASFECQWPLSGCACGPRGG